MLRHCPLMLLIVFSLVFLDRREVKAGPPNEVIQDFPVGQPAKTSWKVHFAHGPGRGLYITGAWFKRAANEPWMQVIYEAGLVELFVPYHSGSPRYYDLTSFNFPLVLASQADAGPNGTVLDSVVVKEVRDRGVMWKDDTAGRRGQELVLWATLDAANYNYVMQYGFQDDGTITIRLGATARNLPSREMEAHMHNGLWRLDIDLDGFPHHSVMLMKHVEPPGSQSATDGAVPFNNGKEGFADWIPTEFTEVSVMNTQKKNGQGKNVSYDLMPKKDGLARHFEDFTHHDFWVTRYHSNERFYTQLPTYIANQESSQDTDVVIWCATSMHHLPRSEDGKFVNGVWDGVALLMWSGFDLRPRDLFDTTPLHP